MSSLNNFSKEETARRTRNIGYRHSAPHQFTNHNSRESQDDAYPTDLRSECCETESETEELSKKHEDQSESSKCEAKTIELVESIEKVAEGGSSKGLSMSSLEISSHDLHRLEEPLEQFCDDGCIRHITEASLVELIEKVTEDYRSAKSFRLPLKTSSDSHHNSEEQLEQVADEVALVETAQNIAEDAGNTIVAPIGISTNTHITENISNTNFIILVPSAENPNILHNAEARPAQYFEVTRSETSRNISEDIRDYLTIPFPEYSNSSLCTSNTATRPQNEDNQILNLTTLSTQILNDEDRCNVEEQSQQPSEENPASKDPQSCFSDSTKATNGVFLLVLNEQFVKAHAGQKLRIEQVQVTTQRTNCNDELNVNQRDGQTSSSERCSKSLENGGKGRISRSAKKKKKFSSAATMIQISNSVPKKVPAVSIPPCSCNNICDKTFSDKYDWGRHMRKHPEPFVCPTCNKPFLKKAHLIEHQLTHSDERPYKCGICDTRFKTDRSKRTHEYNMHTEGARFECAVCGKMFFYKQLLIAHLRVHSSGRCSKRPENCGKGWMSHSVEKKKELPSVATKMETSGNVSKKVPKALTRDSPLYCCNICDKTFSYQSVWKRHQQEHLKSFLCPKCNKPFAEKQYLIEHQATHREKKPYKCRFCDARFKHSRGKLMHERYRHTKVARFECAVCGKIFSYKSAIVLHLRVHSGEKPFCCQTCGASFSQKYGLTKHQQTHSKKRGFKCRVSMQKAI